MDPTSVIERYLALISDPTAELADIEALLDPGMRFVERPNLDQPARQRARPRAGARLGRGGPPAAA